ncbi:MAG: hypothetical protein J7494_07200 [Sphingobium sp.]|nr:hypothetical protein [Sphingobium sp.]
MALIAALTAAASLSSGDAPLRAPAAFVTEQYGLTFPVPSGSLYCPLPSDWTGSDHGTIIFMESPGKCHGAGFPSSGRGFDRDVARIEIFYSYWLEEEGDPDPPENCIRVGTVHFLGGDRAICEQIRAGRMTLSVTAGYRIDTTAQTVFTLVTTSKRIATDLPVFRKVLASTEICSSQWRDGKGGVFATGAGPRCPKEARWF